MKTPRKHRITVYLAGGMHSGWQNTVVDAIGQQALFLDPRSHALKTPRRYVERDLELVRRSDVVFGYLEKSNPSGFGLAVELGYARALGRKIILVNELRTRYTLFCDEVADFAEKDLVAGIARLRTFLRHTGAAK